MPQTRRELWLGSHGVLVHSSKMRPNGGGSLTARSGHVRCSAMGTMHDDTEHLFDQIRTFVAGGFFPTPDGADDEPLDELVLDQVEEWVEDAGLDDELPMFIRFASDLLDARKAAEASWPSRTKNDDLDDAFETMRAAGIVALQNTGTTMADGWSDANSLADDFDAPKGAVFYHGQDLERAIAGQGLMLAFGAYTDDESQHDARSVAVAQATVSILEKHGLEVTWDGTLERRIELKPFAWQKRAFTRGERSRETT